MTAHLRTSMSRLVISGVSLLVALLLAFGIVSGLLPAANASDDRLYGSECSHRSHVHMRGDQWVYHQFVREHLEQFEDDAGQTHTYDWHIWQEHSGGGYGWWWQGPQQWFLCSYQGPSGSI